MIFEPIKKVEPDVPLEPIRRERREVAVDSDDKNKKQLEFSNVEKSESKVLQLKEIKQLLDKDYEVVFRVLAKIPFLKIYLERGMEVWKLTIVQLAEICHWLDFQVTALDQKNCQFNSIKPKS